MKSRFLCQPGNRVARKIWGKTGKLRAKQGKYYSNYSKNEKSSKKHREFFLFIVEWTVS